MSLLLVNKPVVSVSKLKGTVHPKSLFYSLTAHHFVNVRSGDLFSSV